jgi:serine/threonine protein kinase/tetratricopeptide (TPR) repeat protein
MVYDQCLVKSSINQLRPQGPPNVTPSLKPPLTLVLLSGILCTIIRHGSCRNCSRSNDTPMIGKTISHYRVLEKLGEGGMGVVYKAQDTKLNRLVALKFLPSAILATDDVRNRFVHEAQASASLNHPNVATVYEVDEFEGAAFISLEFVEGQNLTDKLKNGPLDVQEAITIAIQMSDGLRAAHEQGIVHRDIKCQNVMVTPEGRVKILDFGLAKLRGASPVTKIGTTVGTMGYMSPEQLLGGSVDHRTDIWALGVVLYEMIAGRKPFYAEFEAAVAYKVMNEPIEPLTAVATGIPAGLDGIMEKLLAKQPDDRYQGIVEVREDLLSLTRPDIPPTRTRRGLDKRTLWKRTLTGGAVLATITIIALLVVLRPASKDQEKQQKSVAVLPFENLSDNKQDEYFSDGMTDELITALAKIDGLRVPGRTSAFLFKGKQEDVRRISEQLNVATVLEGSVRRVGNRVRISAQLIDSKDGFTLWADIYEREMDDIFALQDEITRRIVEVLRVTFREEKHRAGRPPTKNLEAYNLYLRGMYHLNKRSADDIKTGLSYFEEAGRQDTLLALSYAGISEAYVLLASQAALSPREAYPKAVAAARKAVQLDDQSPEAHTCLAHVLFHMGDYRSAAGEFRRALELDPQFAPANHFATEYYTGMNQLDSARISINRALEFDPLDRATNAARASLLIQEKRFDEAVRHLRQTLDLDSNYFLAHLVLGNAYRATGRAEEAASEYKLVARLTGGNRGPGALGLLYASTGRPAEARSILGEMIRRSQNHYTSAGEIARLCAALGEREQTLAWLARSLEDDPWSFNSTQALPEFDFVRTEKRFEEIVRRAHDVDPQDSGP